MKAITISSLFVLAAVTAGMASPAAFADHSEVTITPAGSTDIGCEDASEGCYSPNVATVDVGGKVTMSNTDTVPHTFTAGSVSDGPSGAFDSLLLVPGKSFEWTPDAVGVHTYFCQVRPWMSGTIIVQASDDGDDAMMPKDKSGEGMLSDGTMVSVWSGQPTAGEAMEITVAFADSEHVNYDLMVMQGDEDVYPDGDGAHNHNGMGTHMTAPLGSDDPLDITIVFKGFGLPDADKTGPVGEQVAFTNVVPEFGTIAMMVLAAAIVSIVAVTSRSRMVPRF